MNVRRLLITAVSVGAVVAAVATVSVDILLHWSQSVSVVDISKEQLAGLTETQLQDKILAGEFPTRSVRGAEKAAYLIAHEPMTFVYRWFQYFISCGLSALLGGLIFTGRLGSSSA